ncbi:patatin [Pelomonas sp. HMWF004]|nr:patatin [Pelomonas sp. HMWF004]
MLMAFLIPRLHQATRTVGLLMLSLALGACTAMAPVNPKVDEIKLKDGYRLQELVTRRRAAQTSHALVILAFSGGGTRAAALSYGVLEELRRHPLPGSQAGGTLLDAVNVVTGISGGSFTALSYALQGEQIFETFESSFLKRDVQGELLRRALSPSRWADLASETYGRSELAADYYDEILFKGATFADLLGRPTPAAIVSGTDISTGARFEFTQETFDLLCSDLSGVRLARAAASSSAVPGVLSPVTFHNFGGRCHAPTPSWVEDVADPNNRHRPAGRALLRQRDTEALQDSVNRPYIHLIDGGVSDNLGLRGVIEAFELLEASPRFRAEMGFDQIRHIVVIVVNSRSAPSTDWDRFRKPPGMLSQIFQSANVPIDRYSYESVELLKDVAARWESKRELAVAALRLQGMPEQEAQAQVPRTNFDAIDISFDAITDPEERKYFMELPTSFQLPDEAVDKLRAVAGHLLRTDVRFKNLIGRARAATAGDAKVSAP